MAARGENVLFLPQNLDIWGQKSIFCLVIAIFVDGTNDQYTRGQRLFEQCKKNPHFYCRMASLTQCSVYQINIKVDFVILSCHVTLILVAA